MKLRKRPEGSKKTSRQLAIDRRKTKASLSTNATKNKVTKKGSSITKNSKKVSTPTKRISKKKPESLEKLFFLENVNITGSTDAKKVLQFVELDMTLFGEAKETEVIKTMTGNTKKYDALRTQTYNHFYNILRCHKTLKKLAIIEKNKKTVFENVCGGSRSEYKKHIINACLIVWGKGLVKKEYIGQDMTKLTRKELAKAQLQPSTIQLKHKMLWSVLGDRGIYYQARHFNFQGSYKWYWKNRFAVTKEQRPDFSRQIKKTQYDQYEEDKIWATYYDIDKSFRPYGDITDLLMLLCWRVLKCFVFRGKREPVSLLNENIVIKTEFGGPFKGLKKMTLKGFAVEKSWELTLSNPVERTGEYTSIVEDKHNPLCIVRLVEWYRDKHLPDSYDGKFFCKEVQKIVVFIALSILNLHVRLII